MQTAKREAQEKADQFPADSQVKFLLTNLKEFIILYKNILYTKFM